jgi:SAM-dependent methyltransferase
VLECEAVDEHRAVREATRVLKPGGLLLLWLPAYQFLMTPEHHKAVGAVRRYDKAGIRTLLDGEPLRIIRMTHVFAALFPAIAAFRLAVRALPRNDDQAPRSELNPLPGAVNGLLTWIMTVERRVLRYVDLPFGSSILTVCRKAE